MGRMLSHERAASESQFGSCHGATKVRVRREENRTSSSSHVMKVMLCFSCNKLECVKIYYRR